MRAVYGIIIWVCLIVLMSECDNMLAFVVSKVIAVIMYVAGKLFVKVMPDDELNEKV